MGKPIFSSADAEKLYELVSNGVNIPTPQVNPFADIGGESREQDYRIMREMDEARTKREFEENRKSKISFWLSIAAIVISIATLVATIVC